MYCLFSVDLLIIKRAPRSNKSPHFTVLLSLLEILSVIKTNFSESYIACPFKISSSFFHSDRFELKFQRNI